MIFSDILYGRIDIPDFYIPFIKMPEFVRLRGVRLSNVDSFEFKDFNGPSRWEHSIGVLNLALHYSRLKRLSKEDECHLCLAALLHDVATPPFAHTIEYIFENFDHEFESYNILNSNHSDFLPTNTPIYSNSLPIFTDLCKRKSREIGFKIDTQRIAEFIAGDGDFGYLINGTIDLDNIDNVCRSSTCMGIDVDKKTPYNLLNWLVNFDNAPSDIYNIKNEAVNNWVSYRTKMYSLFFNSNIEELGRQAFLQHIIRRAFDQGMSKESIIWNTDDSLLSAIENLDNSNNENDSYRYNISELVQRYRLLESVTEFVKVSINSTEILSSIKNPLFATWLEKKLATNSFEPFVIINEKRYKGNISDELFQHKGEIIIFHLASREIKRDQLPGWLKDIIIKEYKNNTLRKSIKSIIDSKLNEWLVEKPWTLYNKDRRNDIISNLNHYKDWSFFKTKNQGLHSYPGTFVQSIPSSLISALGLKGELIMDTFGGTGQTATEAIKHGCSAISIDSNSIANMVANAKFTYLSDEQRKFIKNISKIDFINAKAEIINNVELKKWHHPDTINELSKIKTFFSSIEDVHVSQFLKMCFSSILTACTARKGRDYAYFADNTPLPKEIKKAPYISPYPLFLAKIKRNLLVIENFYNSFEEKNIDLNEILDKTIIVHADFLETTPANIGISEKTVKAIITSPPYLCMIDYTLGQRLSYNWLFEENFKNDFDHEIGKRRDRGNTNKAVASYYSAFKEYAKKAKEFLSVGGYLIVILGAPQATSFKDINLFNVIDDIFKEADYELFWSRFRPISHQRNQSNVRLKKERIAIYILKG